MIKFLKASLFILITNVQLICFSQSIQTKDAIISGVPWFDDKGNTVSAHGANIIKEGNRFYLFGEYKNDTSNVFSGFSCYSSSDLCNWKFESVALPVQASGKLGANSVGERPKVMKCPATGEYIMYMHADSQGYKRQFVGYAISRNITGPYIFEGALLFNGNPIRKWDMGAFQDTDGSGYILMHGGDIYKLSDDYKSIVEHVNKAMIKGFESPALFRKDSLYYFLGSHLTGWERNDNYYYTATSLKGPWTSRGLFAPEGTLTWNSQTTFVLPIQGSKETTYMFMGDRWSFPKQASAATYVWQPFTISGYSLSIPQFQEAWKIDILTGVASQVTFNKKTINNNDKQIVWAGKWQKDTLSMKSSDEKDASFSVAFKGTQIDFNGLARPDGGYAQITLRNSKGKTVLTSAVDMYSKYPATLLKYMSPVLPNDNYTLTVTALKENWYWVEKSGRRSGSKGFWVSLDRIVYTDK
jgi:hypothetical protein